MPNLHRGEIEAEIGGIQRRLVLTLGALAELEAAFGAEDLTALAERFGAGRLKARDLVRIIGAGSRGCKPKEVRPDTFASRPRCSPQPSGWNNALWGNRRAHDPRAVSLEASD